MTTKQARPVTLDETRAMIDGRRVVYIKVDDLNPDLVSGELRLEIPIGSQLDFSSIDNQLRMRGFTEMEVDMMLEDFYRRMDILVLSKMLAERMK